MIPPQNIVLIGMPGSGKSTVGVLLAKELALGFVDTDLLIQRHAGRTLQDIVDADGCDALRGIEEEVLLGVDLRGHVIATGGSAVYSDAAMHHLKGNATIVFLDVDLPTLEARVTNYATRGLAKRPGQTFSQLFTERLALYRRYADLVVNCSPLTLDQTCTAVQDALAAGADHA